MNKEKKELKKEIADIIKEQISKDDQRIIRTLDGRIIDIVKEQISKDDQRIIRTLDGRIIEDIDGIRHISVDPSLKYKDKTIEDIEKQVLRGLAMREIKKHCSREVKIEIDTEKDMYGFFDIINTTILIDNKDYVCVDICAGEGNEKKYCVTCCFLPLRFCV